MRVAVVAVFVACSHPGTPPAGSGVVTLAQFMVGADDVAPPVLAGVFDAAPVGTLVAEDSGCAMYSDPPYESTFSVGEIDITGTLATIALQPYGAAPHLQYLDPTTPTNPLFAAGAMIAFHVAGGAGVPELAGTLVAPPPPLGSALPLGALSRSGIHVSWTPNNLPAVEVLLAATSRTTSGVATIDCLLDDSGAADVPLSLLGAIPADYDVATLAFGPYTSVSIGSVTIQLRNMIETGEVALVP